jgi:replicative DNA helicase
MDQEAYRHVPYDIEVEQALLGAVLVDNNTLEAASALLKPDYFYDPLHRRIYETMVQFNERGLAITDLTLHAAMKADPGLIEVGGQDYLTGLAKAAPAMPNLRDLARILADHAVRRSLVRIGEDIVNGAYEAPREKTPGDLIQDAEKALYQVSETSKYGKGPLDFSESLRLAVESAEKAHLRGGRISGVTTGFTEIDGLLGGLQPSDLLILAGRPGMGKTALATNMAFNAARIKARDMEDGVEDSAGTSVLFFSLEMAAQQLAARILSQQTELEMRKIRNGKFSDNEWEKFVTAMGELSNLPLLIDDTGGISIAQIAARSRRLKREKNIGLIVIDYLQLIEPSRRAENRVQEITEVTKGLKNIAKELNVPVLALSQLSRGVDARDDKRPVLSDLRESGSIEQDADVVMFVYREEYYLKSREPDLGTDDGRKDHQRWLERMEKVQGKAVVMVEKHRHGATNSYDLQFDDRFTRFSNLAE